MYPQKLNNTLAEAWIIYMKTWEQQWANPYFIKTEKNRREAKHGCSNSTS
jgi:hypothetical protein